MPTTQDIATQVQGQLIGPGDLSLTGVDALDDAKPGDLTFIRNVSRADGWGRSRATAALVGMDVMIDPGPGRAFIRVPNADLAMAQVLPVFAPPSIQPDLGVHPSAVVDPTATLGRDVRIGPHCTVGRGVQVGDGCILHAHVTLLDEVALGDQCELFPGTVVRERCTIGRRCILHSNVVIGADGFGFHPLPDGRGVIKIPQIGTVRIEDDVEIGAGTCVDRAKFSATLIGEGTKIDNLCQIAHNCRIGKRCILAGQVGLGGSVTLGDDVILGGQAAVKDQVHIGAGARLAACAVVMDDVPAGVTWGGYPAQDLRQTLRGIATLRKLPDMVKTLRQQATTPGSRPPTSGSPGTPGTPGTPGAPGH